MNIPQAYMSTIMPICICAETLAFRWNCCTVEESKFRLAYAVSDEDGGQRNQVRTRYSHLSIFPAENSIQKASRRSVFNDAL